jgi:hypothetical protein
MRRLGAAAVLVLVTMLVPFGAGVSAAASPTARAVDDSCPPGRVPEDGFVDVPDGAAHEDTIDCVVWWKVANGTGPGTYNPSGEVNRGQMASFIARMIDATSADLPVASSDHFADDDGNAHEANINRLAEAGIVSGRDDGSYGAGAPVTRAQMGTFLVRAYEFVGPALTASTDWFADDDGNAHEDNINKAAEAGFTGGRPDGTYGPNDPVRRDQMASFLARVLDLLVEGGFATPPPDTGSSGHVRAVHAVPAGSSAVAGIVPAIQHEIDLVDGWFRSQTTGGVGLSWVRGTGGAVDVQVVAIDRSRSELEGAGDPEGELIQSLQRAGVADPNAIFAVYVEAGGPSSAGCGVTSQGYSILWMTACDIHPDASTPSWPYGATYLLAHEVTHALGAVPACAPHEGNGGHVIDDNRDVLYLGPSARDWENLMLDPGHDDYYHHDIAGCPDIEDAPYWVS